MQQIMRNLKDPEVRRMLDIEQRQADEEDRTEALNRAARRKRDSLRRRGKDRTVVG